MTSETKRCPHCGGEILAAAAKCKHCKRRLTETKASPAGSRACRKCRTANAAGSRICVQCGTKLTTPWPPIMTAGVVVGAITVVVTVVAVVVVHQDGQAFDESLARDQKEAEGRAREAKALASRCAQLAQSGQLVGDDEKMMGGDAPVIKRILGQALERQDFKLDQSALPCGDKLLSRFVDAVAKSEGWSSLESADDVSQDLVQLLSARPKPVLATGAAKALRTLADTKAKEALRTARRTDGFKAATGLCGLAKVLVGVTSSSCKRALARHSRLAKREGASTAGEVEKLVSEVQEATKCPRMCNVARDACNTLSNDGNSRDCHRAYRACMRGCGKTGPEWED